MVRYDKINIDAPRLGAFAQVGLPWAQFLISVGALAGITSVLLVHDAQPAARDAGDGPRRTGAEVVLRRRAPALPHAVEVDHPHRHARRAASAALLPLRILAELVNIGTLLAFVIVCAAVLGHAADAPRRRAAVPCAASCR